jgi:hypothetical protein
MDSQTPPAMATLDRCNDFKNIFAKWRPNDHGIGF